MALLLTACATPTAPAADDTGGLLTSDASIAAPTSPEPTTTSPEPTTTVSAPSPWGIQDGTMATAERVGCDATRSGATTLPKESSPVLGQFSLEDYTLRPPPLGAEPAICVDAALTAVEPRPTGPGATQPTRVWLADFSAQTPAHINSDGSVTPEFTDVLAWVFVFNDLPPMMCAGPPGAPCHTAAPQPSSEIASVDAITGKSMTNEEIGGPSPELHWPQISH
jgi:hypothetical protein